MATSNDIIKDLEEIVKCKVCLSTCNDPKILPCHHSFCQECLEGLPQEREARGDTYYLSCPYCRQCTEVPREGVGAFPVASFVNDVMEIMSKNAPDAQQVTCIDHDKPLDMFCVTCETVICHYCAASYTHKDHKYDLICDSYPKHYQMLRESLKPVKEKKEALKKVLSDIAEREGEIRERETGVLEEIGRMEEEMIGILRQSGRKLTEQVKRVTEAKLAMLSSQTKSVQLSLSLLKVAKHVEQSLKTGTHLQVLRSKKQMMEHISEVTTQINVDMLRSIEKDDLRLIKESAETLKSLHHIGTVSYTSALQQCKVKIHEVNSILTDENVSFSLSIEAPDSSLVSVPVSSLRCSLVPVGKGDEPIHTTVTTTSTHPGVYRIHCNPSTAHGTHTVKVQVYDVELEDTSLFIPFNPYLDDITPVCSITELNDPCGVAVSDDGHVIVTERNGHCVTILDNEGKKVKSFGGKGGSGNAEFFFPRGVAINADNVILVSDNHRIQKISMDGNCVASVGENGSGRLQFNTPFGIAISPITGRVYIADCWNHRIQVLNPDLTFSHSFGKKGSANGQFRVPSDIAIDSQGLVYVTDLDNSRIQKFNPDGTFITQFGSEGTDPGQLNHPIGITIDTAGTGLLYVSEEDNHRVSVFKSGGGFCCSFDLKDMNFPTGLIFDKKGFLYVCSSSNYQIVIY